jgi:O-methyltransferase
MTMKRSWVPPSWLAKTGIRVRNALGRIHAKAVPPPLLVMERLNGLVEAKVLSLVAELGIADRLAGGPRAAVHLAAEAGVDADALDRALGLLVSRGFFARTRDGRYENNAASMVLRSDHPESMRAWAEFFASDWHWEMWNHARHSVATGHSASKEAFGAEFFDYLTTVNPQAGESFNRALAGTSALAGPILAKGYDFSDVMRLCDVGGGTGGMLGEILAVYPSLRGVLFDLPEVADQARAHLGARGLNDRVEVIGGSFFETAPEGCDAYMMQAIVHDWDDDSCVTILSNVRRAMRSGARVLVIENVLSPEPSPADQFARSFDLVMLVTSGRGRERTRAQFDALFARAGFRIARDITLPSQFHVMELRPTAG